MRNTILRMVKDELNDSCGHRLGPVHKMRERADPQMPKEGVYQEYHDQQYQRQQTSQAEQVQRVCAIQLQVTDHFLYEERLFWI